MALFAGRVFFGTVKVQIIEVTSSGSAILFTGRVQYPERDRDAKTLTLHCESGEKDQDSVVNNRKHQRLCPNAIYQRHCGLRFQDWSYQIKVTSVNKDAVCFEVLPSQVRDENNDLVFEQVPLLDENDEPVLDEEDNPMFVDGDPVMQVREIPPGYLELGIFRGSTDITIVSNTSSSLKLYYGTHQIKVNDICEVAPGCNKSIDMCHERYDNHKRYGGNPRVPEHNPVGNLVS